MLVQILAAVAIGQTPVVLEPKVVSAIVLKNGVTMLVREVDLPAGKGDYRIEKIPTAYDGTFWYGTNASKLSDLRTSLKYTKKTIRRNASGFTDLLKANIGEPVQLKVSRGTTEESLSGMIESVENGVLMLRNGDSLRMVAIGGVAELNTSTLTNKEVTAEVDWPELAISFSADSSAKDKFRFLSLETGAVWAGSYLIDIGKDRAEVDGKAQLALGKMQFDNVDVKLLAGEPQLALSGRFDLMTGIGSAADFLNNRQQLYAEMNRNPLDPYERLGAVIRIAATALNTASVGWQGGGMGGFGGSGGQIEYDPSDNSIIVRSSDAFKPQGGNTTSAAANEDVFLYDMGKVTLAPGERLTRPLFHVTSAYESINRWTEGTDETVRKELRLKNDTNLPFTPGSCMVLKNGELLAMTTMPFAAPTQTAAIHLGMVMDLKVAKETVVVNSKRVEGVDPRIPPTFIYTNRKTIILENLREEEAIFEVTTEIDGKIIDAGDAKVTAVDRYFNRPPYFRQRLVWRVTVQPRSTKELRATFETQSR